MAGVISLIAILVIWRFCIVFGAVMFEAAGLTSGAAGFEARSALVGAGFTTSQSELIVRNHAARRVARALIVFGYFGPAILVSLLGWSFVVPTDEDLTQRAVTLAVSIVALVVLDRLGLFRLLGNRPAGSLARRLMDTTVLETWITVGDHVIAAVWIPHDRSRAERVDSMIASSGVEVLALEPPGPGQPTFPKGQPIDLEPGARVILMAPRPLVDTLRDNLQR